MKTFLRAAAALTLECLATLAVAVIASLTEWLPLWLSGIILWAGYPLFGATAAYVATLRGVNNYLAWLPAPLMITLGHWLVWGFLPTPGQMLLSAFVALVGAAAGETRKQFRRRKK